MLPTCDPFIARFDSPLKGKSPSGALAGLRVGVKDGFDIAGHVTGAGCPEWGQFHGAATTTSTVVQVLLDAGAEIIGKTQMDELAYSLMGVNARYGTPLNPAAQDRVPGGSSSGSAASVAAGLVDIGLGSDTGGSVRLPASFCGVYGWRPTHGLMSGDSLVPLAPSYDTPGFFTRDLMTMATVASVFQDAPATVKPIKFWLPSDLWSLAESGVSAALRDALPVVDHRSDPILPDGNLSDWLGAFRIHQGYEIWQTLGPWITQNQPDFGPGIRERFETASRITRQDFDRAVEKRCAIREHLEKAIDPATILVFPTSPGAAPLRSTQQSDLELFRNAALTMLCVAGHAGLPQISIPLATYTGAPVGLSLAGARGADHLLIKTAQIFEPKPQDRA
ncbi:amidase [Roseovarius sp. MS2]|uniref:amidase n=1 Tax=Roseovarius sp. MS2 TaxID=3390728 RepID=UPI003EDC69F4